MSGSDFSGDFSGDFALPSVPLAPWQQAIVSPSGLPLNTTTGTPDGNALGGTALEAWLLIVENRDLAYWREKNRPWWYVFSNGRRFDWDQVSVYGPQQIAPPPPAPPAGPPAPPPNVEDLLTETGQLMLTEGGDDIEIT